MFGPNTIRTTLTLPKILSGISKGLGIANQAIPIYKEVKPIVNNMKNFFTLAKEFKNIGSAKTIDITPKKEVTNHVTSTNNPIFFQ